MNVHFVGNPHREDYAQPQDSVGRTILVPVWEQGVASGLPPYPLRTGEAKVIGRDEYDMESADEATDTVVFKWRERRLS